MFQKIKKKSIKIYNKKFTKLILVIILLSYLLILIRYQYIENVYFKYSLSEEGLSLLNEYEFPKYLIDDSEGAECLRPYYINDGVITFGPGITYPTIEEGLAEVNELYSENYTIDQDCIELEQLYGLQLIKLDYYVKIVENFSYSHRLKLSQNQFDALLLIAYNSPNAFEDENVNLLFEDKEISFNEYVLVFDSYYQTLSSYYENTETEEEDDGFGNGWYNRIIDSAEVYYYSEYEYQNSVIY